MKNNNRTNHPYHSQNDSPIWVAFSIGAISGAVVFLILSLTNRFQATFRRSKIQPQSDLVSESRRNDRSLKSAPRSPLQPGNVSMDQSGSVQAEIPGVDQNFIENKNRSIESTDESSLAGVNEGDSTRTNLPATGVVNAVQTPSSKRWTTPTRYIMGIFLFMAVLAVLFIGRSAIPIVVAAALLAVVLDPIIKFFSHRLRYNLAVGLTYFLVVVLLLALPLLAIPALVEAVNFFTKINYNLMIEQMGEKIQSMITALQANPAWAGILASIQEYLTTLLNNFASQAQPSSPGISLSFGDITSGFGKALGTVTGVLGPTFSALASLFFTIFISFQMTLTTNEMKNWSADLIPPGYEPELIGLITKIRQSWTGFLRGQIFLMLVIGVVTWLGGSIMGIPGALLLGVIAGVMELIPSIGPVIAAVPAILLAVLFGSVHFEVNNLVFALIVIVFYVLVQLLENQILVPRIMGDAVDLPPLVVLIGIIAGAGAFGILGALLATPVIATGNLVFRYIYGKIIEAPPTQSAIEEKPGILDNVRNFISRLRRPTSKDVSRVSAKEKLS